MHDVIVVGAGLSGLVAALELKRYDKTLRLLVLEASNRAGGKIATDVEQDNLDRRLIIETGAQSFVEDQKNVIQLVDSLGLRTIKFTKNENLRDLFVGKKRRTIAPLAALESKIILRRLERWCSKIDPRFPYKNNRLARMLDQETVKHFFDNCTYFSSLSDVAATKLKVLLGRDIASVSMLFFLILASSVGGVHELLFSTRDVMGIRGGMRELIKKLTNSIGIENILYNQPVSHVTNVDGNKLLVTTRCHNTFSCHRIIFAIPTFCLNSVEFQPALSPRLQHVIQNMSPGMTSKFVLIYDKPYWKSEKLSGKVVCFDNPTRSSSPPFTLVFDSTELNSTNGLFSLSGFMIGNESIRVMEMDQESIRSTIIDTLCSFFNNENWPTEAKQFQIAHWSSEQFTGGAVCTPRPGTMENFHFLRTPEKLIYLAGTETATRYLGFLSGAIQAGQRAAIQVLDDIRPQCLSAHDYSILNEIINHENSKESRNDEWKVEPQHVYRWTLGFPLFCIAIGYAAFAFREKYGSLFIPMHH